MNPALRASAAHVFVDDLASPQLATADAHHLFRVLRVRDGEAVTVSDGRGGWRECIVADGAVAAVSEVVTEQQPQRVVIAAAIPKGDRFDWLVQKLTELGASEMVFLHCERSVVRWSRDRVARHMARAHRIAREAAMQSRRVWLPELTGPMEFDDAARLPGAVIADPDGAELDSAQTVLVGPEGGFSERELAVELPRVGLGAHVLRVETAAVAAAAILTRSRRRA